MQNPIKTVQKRKVRANITQEGRHTHKTDKIFANKNPALR